MFVEDTAPFVNPDEHGDTVHYSAPDFVVDHVSSKSIEVNGIFTTEWFEFNGIGGLSPVLKCFVNGESGGRIRYYAQDGTETDYNVRTVQNDGTGLYTWVLEAI